MRLDRRALVLGAAGAAIAGGYVGLRRLDGSYHAAADALTLPLPPDPDTAQLLRYATLAGSSHNTQPWQFAVGERSIDILPDLSRRTPVVDPDDHHLFASLGAVAETLAITARARGLSGEIEIADNGRALKVALDPAPSEDSGLFSAIPFRQCTRSVYDGAPLAGQEADALTGALAGLDVEAVYVDSDADKERLLALVTAASTVQMADSAFLAELRGWLRFNGRAAVETGDGLYAACLGSPSLPDWLGPRVLDLVLNAESEAERNLAHVMSAGAILILSAATDDPPGWIAAGRAYTRVGLAGEALGLKHSFVNQPVEVSALRANLQAEFALGSRRADLILRFGRAPAMPRSLRRPVAEVLVAA